MSRRVYLGRLPPGESPNARCYVSRLPTMKPSRPNRCHQERGRQGELHRHCNTAGRPPLSSYNLYQHFEAFGPIVDCRIMGGFGFLEFGSSRVSFPSMGDACLTRIMICSLQRRLSLHLIGCRGRLQAVQWQTVHGSQRVSCSR